MYKRVNYLVPVRNVQLSNMFDEHFYISTKSMPENPILDKAALVHINQQPLYK